MPFKSKKQQKYMFMHHPKIAARWEDEYGTIQNPKGKKKKKKK
jgi:hypothetical protein